MDKLILRHVETSDYQTVISVLNDWWNGRNMSDMLPRLFFAHFRNTSFVAELDGKIAGFVIGFLSQTFPDEAYIHFSGVHPYFRRKGIGASLYRHFFETAIQHGCRVVRLVTSPINKVSIAFHLRMGFSIEPGDALMEGIYVNQDYDGPSQDRVLFHKLLKT